MSGVADVLALNCGSSSIKYAYLRGETELLRGSVPVGGDGAPDHGAAVHAVLEATERRGLGQPQAVGHRLVHGGPDHVEPERVTPELLASLARVVPFAPLHLPSELRAIAAVSARMSDVPQVVCFDTAFHHTLPEVARRYALPGALFDAGVRRYGFHGLSYEYVVQALGPAPPRRAVLAHLGSGASMAAVHNGRCLDTSMGFTPTGGLVMGTRAGDLDPGLLVHLLQHRGYDARSLDHLVNAEAGMLALSGTTPDMQQLLARRKHDARAALAVDVFCYQARKWVGAFAAALEGLDALVFTGGIGENAPEVRRDICLGLAHLGIRFDDARNTASAPTVSADASPCSVHVVRTDEERMVAQHTRRLVG